MILNGTSGVDSLIGSDVDDQIYGREGDDQISGGGGNDTLYGESGDDQVFDGAGNDILMGGAGNDRIYDIYGDNRLYGEDGNDQLVSGAGNDYLEGGAGDDWLLGGAGSDTLYGGAGNDTADYSTAAAGGPAGSGLKPDSYGSYRGISVDLNNGSGYSDRSSDKLVDIENLIGSQYDDVLFGNSGGNVFEGGQGNDNLDGGGGSDTASYAGETSSVTVSLLKQGAMQSTGAAGDDILKNFENITGGKGNDTLEGDAGSNILDGGAGIDTVTYASATSGVTLSLQSIGKMQATNGAVSDTLISIEKIIGSAFDDKLTAAEAYSSSINAGAGNDTLIGGSFSDTLCGEAGNDIIDGGINSDIVYGGEGADVINGGAHNDKLYGDEGNDTISGGDGDDVVDGGYASGPIDSGNDILTGGAGNDRLAGRHGDDLLNGGEGNDYLHGGSGSDTASYVGASSGVMVSLLKQGAAQATGGAGSDTLVDIQNLIGSEGDDLLEGDGFSNVIAGGLGNDLLDGREGGDTVSYAQSAVGVTVSLLKQGLAQDTGGAGIDTLSNFENLQGGLGDDILEGDDFNNILAGGSGNDTLLGGSGIDTASYMGASTGVTVSLLKQGIAQNTVGAGTDVLSGLESLLGSAYNDTLTGDAGNNELDGAGGHDKLQGGVGTDRIYGGTGNDLLDGGAGYDILFGGAGRDIFRYTSVSHIGVTGGERIGDFVTGVDRIDLSAIDAKTGATVNDSFTLITASTLSASNANGALWYEGGKLYGSTDNDLSAEFVINLSGSLSLAAQDLIL